MKILILLSAIFTGFVMPLIVYIQNPSMGPRLLFGYSLFWITMVPVIFFLWNIFDSQEDTIE